MVNESPYIAGWYYVPLSRLTDSDLVYIKRKLTFISNKDEYQENVEPIRLYHIREGYIGLPVDWGINSFGKHIDGFLDKTTTGIEDFSPVKFPDPNHERAAPGQQKFMSDMLQAVQDNYAILAIAPTGTGKTVTTLNTIGKLGHKALIVTHLERLAMQWADEAHQKLGIPKHRIGVAKQNKAEYKDKDIVVGIMHSLGMRKYPKEFYNAFGTVVWDEVHRVGAPLFSKTLGLFPSSYKIALTATPTRKDGCAGVFKSYFGDGQVVATSKPLKCQVKVLDYYGNDRFLWGKQHGSRVRAITMDSDRNSLIANLIVDAYNKGRKILVVSERIQHLQDLISMVTSAGVPPNKVGQFTGMYYTGAKRNKVSKDGKVTLVPECKKIKSDYLDWVKTKATVIFATYNMMSEGIDIPRLDFGIDATPRTDAIQLIGRIRRPFKNKPQPEWVTIRDVKSRVFCNYYNERLKDYAKSNAEVKRYE